MSKKARRQERPISTFDILNIQDNSTRVVYCDLVDYIGRDPNFISTLCDCGSEFCTQLHHNNNQSDFVSEENL